MYHMYHTTCFTKMPHLNVSEMAGGTVNVSSQQSSLKARPPNVDIGTDMHATIN